MHAQESTLRACVVLYRQHQKVLVPLLTYPQNLNYLLDILTGGFSFVDPKYLTEWNVSQKT
jgi:hypothetical protein